MKITIEIDDSCITYDPCVLCPNNPKNGGSGICCCSLPYIYGKNKIIS